MPEGDTLHRTANRLRPALLGATVTAFEAPRLKGERVAVGSTVTEVEAVGKHLLISFDDGLVLRTHLGMPGSWRLQPEGRAVRRGGLRVRLAVPGWEALCFAAPVVETTRAGKARLVGHLGPDLCTPEPDLDEALRRYAAAPPETEIAVALLDQQLASGIGNVYKSEVLHRLRVDPFVALGEVPVDVRRRLLEVANRLLLVNLDTPVRTTVSGPPGTTAVYGREGKPCRVCSTPVERRRQGEQNRSTYWCPRCQPPGAVGVVGPPDLTEIGVPGRPRSR